jgi:hypothetical protein
MYSTFKDILATAITFACASTIFAAPAPVVGFNTSFGTDVSHVQNYGITTGTNASDVFNNLTISISLAINALQTHLNLSVSRK